MAFSPFKNRKSETFSYLPALSAAKIEKQIDFIIRNRWVPCIEFNDDPHIYANSALGPGYYDNRYWSIYKLPLFGCTQAAQVSALIQACRTQYPAASVRLISFDPKKQVQSMCFVIKK